MSERNAFVSHILREPACDAHRLVFADWLTEHGAPERAEFIRVQCELSANDGHGHGVGKPHGGECAECLRLAQLGKRERTLLTALRQCLRSELPSPQPDCHSWGLYLARHEDDTPDDYTISLERGFGCRLTCPIRFFLRRAAGLFAAHPFEAVGLTGRMPCADACDQTWGWFKRDPGGRFSGEEAELSPELWDELPGDADERDGQAGAGWWRSYGSTREAFDALSRACVAYGRKEARTEEAA